MTRFDHLRDLWNIPIEGHRVAVTEDQIAELELQNDFNPAKEKTPDTKASLIALAANQPGNVKRCRQSSCATVLGWPSSRT